MKKKTCGSIMTVPVTPKHGGRDYRVTYFTCGKCGVKRRARGMEPARQMWGVHRAPLPHLYMTFWARPLTDNEVEAVWVPEGFEDPL